MKIYIVRHHWNNGEHYEEYREYIEDSLFSTEDKAYAFFCDKIIPNYIGEYSLLKKELDTQKETLIEQSPWIDCAPCSYGFEEDEDDFEIPDDEWEPIDPRDSLEEYKSIQEELKAEEEWLTTRREQGEILDEIEADRINDTLEESDKMWASLGMLD